MFINYSSSRSASSSDSSQSPSPTSQRRQRYNSHREPQGGPVQISTQRHGARSPPGPRKHIKVRSPSPKRRYSPGNIKCPKKINQSKFQSKHKNKFII